MGKQKLNKNYILILSFICGLVNLNAQQKLVWSDEFNYKGLPDSTIWSFDTGNGCPQLCGWGNNELQYYTYKDTNNIAVSNGVLKITALKQTKDSYNYTSAKILSKNKVNLKYGRIECRAKFPTAKGTWPAFWMLGANNDSIAWPYCGEIDIVEHKGNDLNTIYGTLHYPQYYGNKANGSTQLIKDVHNFHLYSIDWNSTTISFFVDKKLYHKVTIKKDMPFNQPFYFLINLAIGGNFAGKVADDFQYDNLEIDYIRVYK